MENWKSLLLLGLKMKKKRGVRYYWWWWKGSGSHHFCMACISSLSTDLGDWFSLTFIAVPPVPAFLALALIGFSAGPVQPTAGLTDSCNRGGTCWTWWHGSLCSWQHAAGLGVGGGPHREGTGAAHPTMAAAAPAWPLAGGSKPRGRAGPCHHGWYRTLAQHHAHRRPAECSCQVLMSHGPSVSLSVSLGTSVIATLTHCWFIGAQNADQTAGRLL